MGLPQRFTTFVKSAARFLQEINVKKIGENEVMVSFDVISLFTSVPKNEFRHH